MPRITTDRDLEIARQYAAGYLLTEQIAKSFKLTPRRIAQIAKRMGVVRSVAEANRVAAPLKRKHRTSHRRYGFQNQSVLLEQLGMPTKER